MASQRFSKPTDQQTNSRLFGKLPAELRNKIYAFVHTYERKGLCNNHQHNRFCNISSHAMLGYATIDLKAMTTPKNNLAFTCQLLHTESRRFFKEAVRTYWRSPFAYQNFWHKNEFVIQVHDRGPCSAALHNLDDAALLLATKFQIELCHRDHNGVFRATLHLAKDLPSNNRTYWSNDADPLPWSTPTMGATLDMYRRLESFHYSCSQSADKHLGILNNVYRLDSASLRKFLSALGSDMPGKVYLS